MSMYEHFIKNIYHCPITGCWIWCGYLTPNGYSRTTIKGKGVYLHKLFWEELNGPVPNGLVLDHFKCDNPSCVNPDHVRPVSPLENTLRSSNPTSINLAKRNCPKCGGGYTENKNGTRYCYPCWYSNIGGVSGKEYFKLRARASREKKKHSKMVE